MYQADLAFILVERSENMWCRHIDNGKVSLQHSSSTPQRKLEPQSWDVANLKLGELELGCEGCRVEPVYMRGVLMAWPRAKPSKKKHWFLGLEALGQP